MAPGGVVTITRGQGLGQQQSNQEGYSQSQGSGKAGCCLQKTEIVSKSCPNPCSRNQGNDKVSGLLTEAGTASTFLSHNQS